MILTYFITFYYIVKNRRKRSDRRRRLPPITQSDPKRIGIFVYYAIHDQIHSETRNGPPNQSYATTESERVHQTRSSIDTLPLYELPPDYNHIYHMNRSND